MLGVTTNKIKEILLHTCIHHDISDKHKLISIVIHADKNTAKEVTQQILLSNEVYIITSQKAPTCGTLYRCVNI